VSVRRPSPTAGRIQPRQVRLEGSGAWNVPDTTETPASSAALSGQAVTVSAGTLAPASSVALSGQAVTASAGTLAPSSSVALSGQAVTASAGTLSPASAIALSGQDVTVSSGTLAPSSSVALSGQAVTASAGTLAPSTTIGLVGTEVTVFTGTVTSDSDLTIALAGESVTVSAGTLGVESSLGLTGQQVSAETGTLGAQGGVTAVQTPSGGYWPDYGQPRRKRRQVLDETEVVAESPAELESRMLRVAAQIKTAKALRLAEARSREVTAQIKSIYAEQDRLEGRIVAMKDALQRQEDDEIAMILALAG
jgi:hypothetical protein